MTSAAAVGRSSRRRPPLVLGAAAVLAVSAVSLPLVYLVLRASPEAWAVLQRERLLELVLRTALLVVAVTAGSSALALPLAWLVARTDLPGRRLWAVAAALPLVVPSYVAALALIAAFGPRGLLQGLLEEPFGVERVPAIYGFPGAVFALVISTYPYVYLLATAALRGLDPALEEAARALGRSPAAVFQTVTMPVVRPALAAGGLLVALYTLSDFGAVSLMHYDSLTRAIFFQYRALFDRTPAAVLALVLVALTVAVLVLELRFRGRGRMARGSPGAARRAAPVRLGRWRWPALVFCGAVVGLALLVPLGVLAYWGARGLADETALEPVWRPALNAVFVSVLAAGAALAAALPVALVSVRYPARWTRMLESASYVSNALPGIVVALALVFFASRYATAIYQTLGLLVAAYVVRFFAQAVAGSHSALLRVDVRLEEAGRALGHPPSRVFLRVTGPLLAPGLAAAAALVFLNTMKELPATLLLRPIGFETLATEIWTATAVGFYSRAAIPALLLVLAAAPLVYLLAGRETAVDPPG